MIFSHVSLVSFSGVVPLSSEMVSGKSSTVMGKCL